MIVFGRTTIDDEVKKWSYARLKKTFEGHLDYEALAKQLGIKEAKPKDAEKKKNKDK